MKCQKKNQLTVFVLSLAIIVGCSEPDASFSLLSDSDVFLQSSSNVSPKIDILWVIDNSGSMSNSQADLVANFSSFMDGFAQRDFDFQLAVTTTDAWRAIQSGDPEDSKYKDGASGNHTGIFVVTPETPDYVNVFLTNVLQGVWGSGDERGLQSFREALENPLNLSLGFPRQDAFLAIIVVSDEEDRSRDIGQPTSNPHPVQDYVDFLDAYTGSTASYKKYSVSSLVILDNDCNSQIWGSLGTRYAEISTLTGGVSGSLCEDFSVVLDLISDGILQLATQFYLSRIPVESSIQVFVNDVVMPKVSDPLDPINGWLYDPNANSIIFYGTSIPSQGDKVFVHYDPVSVGQ